MSLLADPVMKRRRTDDIQHLRDRASIGERERGGVMGGIQGLNDAKVSTSTRTAEEPRR